MFRMTRRWILWVGMSILPVGSPFLTIYVRAHPDLYTETTVQGLLVLLFVIAGAVSYLNLVQPVQRMEPIALSFLDKLGEVIYNFALQDGLQPRLNILLVYRDKRWLFLRRYLRIVWSRGMSYQPDQHARFPITKGVAGEVCRKKIPILANLEEQGHQDWGFTKKEAENFAPLTTIYSWPIYRLDAFRRATSQVLGTVNLDAETPQAAKKIAARIDEYKALMADFTEFASSLLSLS